MADGIENDLEIEAAFLAERLGLRHIPLLTLETSLKTEEVDTGGYGVTIGVVKGTSGWTGFLTGVCLIIGSAFVAINLDLSKNLQTIWYWDEQLTIRVSKR